MASVSILDRVKLPPPMEQALQDLETRVMPGPEKSLPPGPIRPADISRQGWNLLRGDVPLPSMVLNWGAVEHNIALMQAYCDRHGVRLAPHGKTTMAPQIWAAQLRAGAWAITVANIAQVEVCRAFGVPRVLVANELTSDYDLRYLGRLLRDGPPMELYALADSVRGARRLAEGLEPFQTRRPLRVLVELGLPGGRTGARTLDELAAIADAVQRTGPTLQLAGVEGYEGVVSTVEAADAFLKSLSAAADLIAPRLPAGQECLVSAGGSIYFDRVVELLQSPARPQVRVVLRSGCYVTHDSGRYEHRSPFGARARAAGEPALRAALELWAAVLSRPEPGLVLLGMGKRDMPTDLELPIPFARARPGQELSTLDKAYAVVQSNDQHAFLRVPPDSDLAAGDLVGCGISHPCTAFDKWRVLLVADDAHNITGAVRTFF